MTNKITAITSRQAVMADYIPPLDNIINNFTVVYSNKDQGLIRLLLKLINELDKKNKLMFISLLSKSDYIIKRAKIYSDINLTLDNIYVVDNSKISIKDIINTIKEKNIKVLVIDSFDLLEEAKTDKKTLLESLYNLKNHGTTVIVGMEFSKPDKALIEYIKTMSNVISINKLNKEKWSYGTI